MWDVGLEVSGRDPIWGVRRGKHRRRTVAYSGAIVGKPNSSPEFAVLTTPSAKI